MLVGRCGRVDRTDCSPVRAAKSVGRPVLAANRYFWCAEMMSLAKMRSWVIFNVSQVP